MARLLGMRRFHRLLHLSLAGCSSITDKSLLNIASQPCCFTLETLDLRCCSRLSTRAILELIGKLPRLRSLEVWTNGRPQHLMDVCAVAEELCADIVPGSGVLPSLDLGMSWLSWCATHGVSDTSTAPVCAWDGCPVRDDEFHHGASLLRPMIVCRQGTGIAGTFPSELFHACGIHGRLFREDKGGILGKAATVWWCCICNRLFRERDIWSRSERGYPEGKCCQCACAVRSDRIWWPSVKQWGSENMLPCVALVHVARQENVCVSGEEMAEYRMSSVLARELRVWATEREVRRCREIENCEKEDDEDKEEKEKVYGKKEEEEEGKGNDDEERRMSKKEKETREGTPHRDLNAERRKDLFTMVHRVLHEMQQQKGYHYFALVFASLEQTSPNSDNFGRVYSHVFCGSFQNGLGYSLPSHLNARGDSHASSRFNGSCYQDINPLSPFITIYADRESHSL